ncbi:MAG: hypothetical protein ABL892_07000 [Thiobacillaceae bacterium]
MKTCSPQRHKGAEKNKPIRRGMMHLCSALIFSVSLCLCGSGFAAQPAPDLPGRLFYTPEERAMLVNARTHKVTELQKSSALPDSGPVRFDGVLTRSDGVGTHWVNGRAHVGQSSVGIRNLKPGQIRADKKIYEPYQVLRQSESLKTPNTTEHKEAAP